MGIEYIEIKNGFELMKTTVLAFGRFSALWNYFETLLWEHKNKNDNEASRASFKSEKYAEQLAKDGLLYFDKGEMNKLRIALVELMKTKWAVEDIHEFVYYSPNGLYPQGARVVARTSEDKTMAESFLKNEDGDIAQARGCVVILFRIRSNMFHGLKEVYGLDSQCKLFEAANDCLASMVLRRD